MGVPLFLRRPAQALALTPTGRQLLAEARRLLAAAEALSPAGGGAVAGPLAVGCLKTFAQLVLPGLRRGFEAAHPAVRLRQAEMDHADLIDRLLVGEVDLGLSYDLALPQDVDFAPLATLPPMVMLPGGHPLAAKGLLTLHDLAKEPMVFLDLPYSGAYFLQLFEAAGLRPRIGERTRDMSVLRTLVGNGYGYTIVNLQSRQADAPDSTPLAFVPLASGLRPLRLGLMAVAGGFAQGALAAFRDHALAEVAARWLPGCVPPEGWAAV